MTGDGGQSFFEQVDVFDEGAAGDVGDLGGTVAADRDQALAVEPKTVPNTQSS